MKQYCRYCTWLCTGNGIYCQAKGEAKTEAYAKRPNKCRLFDYANVPPELQDAFMENERGYRPRKQKKKQCDGQMEVNL